MVTIEVQQLTEYITLMRVMLTIIIPLQKLGATTNHHHQIIIEIEAVQVPQGQRQQPPHTVPIIHEHPIMKQ